MATEEDDTVVDAVLARRIIAGDRAAEADLCRRMLPRVRAWGLKHLRDESAALDLGQQVLVTLIEALRANRVTELDRLGAFVLGVCKNTVMAMRRGEHRRADLLARYGSMFDDAATIDTSTLDQRHLATCFETLAMRARTLLALTFFVEASADAIARELGTTVGNVRVLRHRALADLHRCMEACA